MTLRAVRARVLGQRARTLGLLPTWGRATPVVSMGALMSSFTVMEDSSEGSVPLDLSPRPEE